LFGPGENPARLVPSIMLALREGREARVFFRQASAGLHQHAKPPPPPLPHSRRVMSLAR
jgi:hypothetical protein